MRPLPGFRFDARPPEAADVLPRMDVAMFVGFAARGPLHTPVAVDDVGRFAAVFGEDAALAWDAERGEPAFACLAPAVRAFFRNGGRRCWIVRVADNPVFNAFAIPGLLRLDAGRLSPAFARARSAGSWSDSLRIGSALNARSMSVLAMSAGPRVLLPVAASDLQPGDVLRVTFGDGRAAFVPIARVDGGQDSPPFEGPAAWVTGDPSSTIWFDRNPPAGLSGTVATARAFTEDRTGRIGSPPNPLGTTPVDATGVAIAIVNPPEQWPRPDGLVELDLDMPFESAPPPGAMVRIDAGTHEGWVSVQQLGAHDRLTAGGRPTVRVRGSGWWRMSAPPAVEALQATGAEVLQLSLAVRNGREESTLHDLGLAKGHTRFWNALESDDEAFNRARATAFRQEVAIDLFPLCGDGTAATTFVPLGVAMQVSAWVGPLLRAATPLERDGLARFDAAVFLDPDLAPMGMASLAAGADFIRYARVPPRPLRGIYTAFDIDEVTVIAVPDAIHRGWTQQPIDLPGDPPQTPPPIRPDWWRFRDCPLKTSDIPRVSSPEWGRFLRCDIRLIAAPRLQPIDALSESGTFTLSWELAAAVDRFVLEESASEDFSGDRAVVYEGPATRFTMYGRAPGVYYYRVRAAIRDQISDWSNSRVVRVGARLTARLQPLRDYSPVALLDLHRALLRLAAARGDLLAALALPEHYREQEAIAHTDGLQQSTPRGAVPTLHGDLPALGYGALYHPWLIGREPLETSPLRRVPPDGAACGVIARRTMARGAWIAAANEPLRGAVALHPPLAREHHQALQDAQINVIRQEPRGIVMLNADTLSRDRDLRPINVRRLLSLLRRQALRLGATYVFEPHDDAFRRLVRRGFEGMLDQMFLRGAFAGSTAASSYQVVISSSLNTQQSVDRGRLIVELRVAPSLPLTFLAIRLVQSGERGFVTEVR